MCENNMSIPNFNNIVAAHQRINNLVNHTPVMTSRYINQLAGADVYFKCENFQRVGAFKFRGACNALLCLSEEELSNGVATHSSGNHAQALALAASLLNTHAAIVMPINSPKVKKDAVAGYGAEIIMCEPTLQAREDALNSFIDKSGAVFIHPYNNFNVICGQGTAVLELMTDFPDLDIISAPVGGGGLISGTAVCAKALNHSIQVVGVEPLAADDACRSLAEGRMLPSNNPKTIADGLLTSLGELTFKIISQSVDQIVTVSEESIIKAMKLVFERMKLVIEPSSAVPLAALLEKKYDFEGKKIGIIISGGNVDLEKLPWLD